MPRRWSLVLWTGVIVPALVLASYAADPGEAGLRAGIRLTARTSLLLFLLAFTASSVHALWRGPASKWMLANRRYLGLSFAVSHALHAALIAALDATTAYSVTDNVTGLAGGLVGYAALIALTITSFDGPTRALGRRWWKRLHKAGVYVLWGIFAFTYIPLAIRAPGYAPLAALVVGALALRIAASWPQAAAMSPPPE